jgi:hypothetical protein
LFLLTAPRVLLQATAVQEDGFCRFGKLGRTAVLAGSYQRIVVGLLAAQVRVDYRQIGELLGPS